MKNVSKWLLTGSVLALAFSCQSKKSEEKSDQNSSKSCGHQSQMEKPASQPTVEVKETPSPVAEKKATPLSVPAVRVAEQNVAPAAKEDLAPSPVATESKPASSEVKTETATKIDSSTSPVSNVTENQSAPATSSK